MRSWELWYRTCSYPVYFRSASRTSGTGLMPMCQRGLYLLLEEPETYTGTPSAHIQPALSMIIVSKCKHFVYLSVSYAISAFRNITVISTNASSAWFIFQNRYNENLQFWSQIVESILFEGDIKYLWKTLAPLRKCNSLSVICWENNHKRDLEWGWG